MCKIGNCFFFSRCVFLQLAIYLILREAFRLWRAGAETAWTWGQPFGDRFWDKLLFAAPSQSWVESLAFLGAIPVVLRCILRRTIPSGVEMLLVLVFSCLFSGILAIAQSLVLRSYVFNDKTPGENIIQPELVGGFIIAIELLSIIYFSFQLYKNKIPVQSNSGSQ